MEVPLFAEGRFETLGVVFTAEVMDLVVVFKVLGVVFAVVLAVVFAVVFGVALAVVFATRTTGSCKASFIS